MTERREPQEGGAIFLRKRAADLRLLLHKFRPEILVIGEQIERRGQAEVVAVIVQELEAEGVNGAEPGAIEGRENFRRGSAAQNLFARALLHFIGGAIGESDDDEARQTP